jgi:hypothetical protein
MISYIDSILYFESEIQSANFTLKILIANNSIWKIKYPCFATQDLEKM